MVAAQDWEELESWGRGVQLLSHPRRALLRYALLDELHRAGMNRYRAYRVPVDDAADPRFPVFLRHEHSHAGSITPLLRTRAELDAAIASATRQGGDRARLLVVEYCDTADEHGVHRKYAAIQVGDEVIPRHLLFDRAWVLKEPGLIDPGKAEEQTEYLRTNPHEEWIREVFRIGRIDYGRIDYGIVDGVPQAWEINTNPNLMRAVSYYPAPHRDAPRYFAPRIAAAFDALDRAGPAPAPIPVDIGGSIPSPRRPGVRWIARRVGWAVKRARRRVGWLRRYAFGRYDALR